MSLSTETPAHHGCGAAPRMAAVLLAGTALGGFAVGHAGFAATEATPGAPVNPPGSGMTGHRLPDFTDLVTQVKPAVVSITTKLQADRAGDEDQAQMPMPFRGFPFGGMGPQMGPQAHAVEARGSGFIVDAERHHRHQQPRGEGREDGVRHAGRRHQAAGQGDRARCRAPTSPCSRSMPTSRFPTSSSAIRANVKPGEWVVAMGNPFGLGGIGDRRHRLGQSAATSAPVRMTSSSRSTRRSTRAIRAGRCSPRTARSSA